MKQYRKKPIVIEAIQITASMLNNKRIDHVSIETLEGTMIGNIGDWIIRGIKGELYPCKPDIFEKTYFLPR